MHAIYKSLRQPWLVSRVVGWRRLRRKQKRMLDGWPGWVRPLASADELGKCEVDPGTKLCMKYHLQRSLTAVCSRTCLVCWQIARISA